MSRFLFVVPPLTGHVNPTIGLSAELTERGHQVAWCGLPGAVDPLLAPDATFFAAADGATTLRLATSMVRPATLRGAAALKFLWEQVLLPLGDAMVDGVDQAAQAYQPDVIIADQQALAGPIIAARRKIPWVTSATTSGELVSPLASLPLVESMIRERMTALQVAHGIDESVAQTIDLRFSPQLTIAYTTEALVGPGPFPGPIGFVGPTIHVVAHPEDFPWDWLDDGVPRVLVSLGTVNAEAGVRFWTVAADACRNAPFQAIFIAPEDLVPDPPANVLVRQRVPQLALLEHVDAVVSHGGHNTVCESLARGVPLVVAPIRDDQPIVAEQVAQAGAGVRVKFTRIRAAELREAIDDVLHNPDLRAGAARVSESFRAAGGAPAAADLLEHL